MLSFLYSPTLTSYMTPGKTIALTRWTFAGKEMSLLFNMLSRLVVTFLPRSKHLLISWLQSPSAVILEPPPPNKVCHFFHCFPSICHEVMEPDAMIVVFWMMSFKTAVSLCSFTLIKETPGSSAGQESVCKAGDLGSIPGLGRSPGEKSIISNMQMTPPLWQKVKKN